MPSSFFFEPESSFLAGWLCEGAGAGPEAALAVEPALCGWLASVDAVLAEEPLLELCEADKLALEV